MTKIWVQAANTEEYTEGRFLNDISNHIDVYMLVIGCQSLAGRFPSTTIEILSKDRPLADYFDVGTMFIVSEKLKSAFDEVSINCEYFPLRVMYEDKEFTQWNYYFCNILDCVDGFDLTRGKYTFWKTAGFTDHIEKIKKLAIDESKVQNYKIFRLAKCSPVIACVCDRLADRIQERKLTGMRFIEPKNWRFGM